MNAKHNNLKATLLSHFDSAPFSNFHLKLLFVAGSGWIWAAYGTVAVGLVIPSLREFWGYSSSQLGLIASLNLAGMLVGSILSGIFADKVGRRKALALAVLIEGIFTLLSAFSWNYSSLLIFRFLTGLGLGGVLPVASTLVGEFSPAKYRGRILVLLNGFWGLGIAIAALVGYVLIPVWGWRTVLAFGGLAIFFAPFTLHFMPESLRYLIDNGRYQEAITTAEKIFPNVNLNLDSITENENLEEENDTPKEEVPLGIFSKILAKRTVALWFLWFSLNFLFQGIFVWLPSILVQGGHPLAKSLFFTMLIGLCQLPGSFIAAYLVDKIGRRISIFVFFALFGVFSVLFGFANSDLEILLWGGFLGLCNGATWGLAYPFTTELYPTKIRGTGAGWATGFGRAGGILAPFLVGVLLQIGFSNLCIYLLFAILCALTAFVIFLLRDETKGLALEDINS